jgi:hypothetical protein
MLTAEAQGGATRVRRTHPVEQFPPERLLKARADERLGEHAPTAKGAAYSFDRARVWRSLVLVADAHAAPGDPAAGAPAKAPV